jgi:hypothetical protein
MIGGSLRSPLASERTQPSSPKARALAVTSGDGLAKVRKWEHSCERIASSRAERRSRKVIPERSTRVGLRRLATPFSASRSLASEKRSNSPHSSTRMPAPDCRTSMPYKSHLPIDLWVRPTRYRNIWDPITCGVVTVYEILLARFPYVSRRIGFCYLT